MTIYTLYVKTHRKTGLKYLGQTSQDPFRYPGSGIDWKSHLKEFGNDVHTEVLLQTVDKSERNLWGRYYSALWHIVTAVDDFGNKIWANKIPETGCGERPKDSYTNPSFRKRQSVTQKKIWSQPVMKAKRCLTQQKRIVEGTHNLLGPENNSKRIEEGTHNFILDDGPNKTRVSCLVCKKETSLPTFHRSHGDKCNHGKNNYQYNHTIYNFVHDDGRQVSCTQHELHLLFDIPKSNLSRMIKGDRKMVHGWRLKK